ncbi:MAG: YqjD family protein [Lautropia sp.]
MTDISADKIASRLEEAAEAIERSLKRTRRSIGSAASDLGDQSRNSIEKEWTALKKDLADLMGRTDLAESPEVKAVVERIRATMSSISDTVVDAASEAQRRARESAGVVDDYAHQSPWQAVGIAAAAGFVIGALLARR